MSSNINNVNSPVKKGDIITMTNDKVISTQMKITTESVEVSPPRNDLNNEEKKVINDKKQRKPRRSKEEIAAEKAEKIAIKEKKAALKASKEQEKIQKAEEKAANKASKEQEKKRIIEEKATQKKARKPNRSKEEIQAEKQAKAEAKEKKAILKQAREAEKKRLAEEKAAAKANKVKKQYEVDVDILSPITNDNSTQGSPKKNDDKEIKKESPQNNEENKCDDEFNAIFQNDGIENDEDSDSDTCAEIDNEFIEEKFNKFKSLIKKAEEQEANRTQRTRGHDAWLEELKSFYTEFAVMLGHDGSI